MKTLITFLIFTSHIMANFNPNKDTFFIRPYGNVDESDLIDAIQIIKEEFNFTCVVQPMIPIDESLIITNSKNILEAHQTLKSLKVNKKTLYITENKLWTNKIYLRGYSFLNGNVMIVQGDKNFLRETIIHEIGHIFGLDHCGDKTCIMAVLNDAFDSGRFCNRCLQFLKDYSKIK